MVEDVLYRVEVSAVHRHTLVDEARPRFELDVRRGRAEGGHGVAEGRDEALEVRLGTLGGRGDGDGRGSDGIHAPDDGGGGRRDDHSQGHVCVCVLLLLLGVLERNWRTGDGRRATGPSPGSNAGRRGGGLRQGSLLLAGERGGG